jgi:5'-deoxynucleotidase YfbR-like HD superfamily hydrolase
MDAKAIHRLDAHARTLAEKLGVHATVSLKEIDESEVTPTGPWVVLTVFHDAAETRHRDLRPDAPNLMARIEQEIPLLAQELGQH